MATAQPRSIYEVEVPRLDGKPARLSEYEGNQFFNQEPGSAEKIQEFCSTNYGVTFPLFAKLDVKGSHQHPLYEILSEAADDAGKAGYVKWNFEKFLVGRDGKVVRRFRSKVVPEDPQLVEAIDSLL